MIDPQSRGRRRRPRGSPLDHAPDAVRYARQNAGLTQEELAASLGLTRQRICDIERGRRNAPPELLEAMAARLDCPLVVLQAKPPADERPHRPHRAQN
ncbi:helix-turn-helix transcriptional regulator [Streptomyces sp. MNU103]|uniref:helix-turn-helix transcriptional regulator n=1 Tax=Streptomyces sp. MNU103 TaxID=2560024 RepID=UPI001E49D66B|nr:helix-turn-helix domain-containing protein [Streptomyces sp. MNU103]